MKRKGKKKDEKKGIYERKLRRKTMKLSLEINGKRQVKMVIRK